jgi:AcrR family transcriptional regulator
MAEGTRSAALKASRPATTLTKAGRARKRDPERTSAAILAAAITEFSLRGYDGARVDAIARRAKINKRMLYHYFGSKEGLYLAVLEGRYAAIRSAETLLDLTHRQPVEAMRDLIDFTWQYFLDHPEFLSILAAENERRRRQGVQAGRRPGATLHQHRLPRRFLPLQPLDAVDHFPP